MANGDAAAAAAGSDVSYLNAAAAVTALAAGSLGGGGGGGGGGAGVQAASAAGGRDVLLVGTASNLLAYDVHRNADSWFKEMQDGVSRLAVGPLHGAGDGAPLAIVGGNCSVIGLDAAGEEALWTVTGDNVGAMCLADVDGDGKKELVVGSDDFDIRVFRGEEVIAETTEAERIVGLTDLSGVTYGYALGNGTVGVYSRGARAWRVKSKYQVKALGAYDLDDDGVPELVSGWSNGKLEVRLESTGEIVYKDNLGSAVAAVDVADYRMDGKDELIVCSVNGEVKGYLPAERVADDAGLNNIGGDGAGSLMDADANEERIQSLAQTRAELLFQLQALDARVGKGASSNTSSVIPVSTRLDHRLEQNVRAGAIDLVLNCTPPAVITGALIFGERIFTDESLYAVPSPPASEFRVQLRPKVDQPVAIVGKVIVSMPGAAGYHVFELEETLGAYAMYKRAAPGQVPVPNAGVTFSLSPSAIPMLAHWIGTSLASGAEKEGALAPARVVDDSGNVDEVFVSLRDGSALAIRANAAVGEVTVRCEDMDVAGNIVQDICAVLDITDLESQADFPTQMDTFAEVLARVEQYNDTRVRMTAEMAEITNTVKALVVKAEDARLMGNMPHMCKMYGAMRDANRDLVLEHTKRATNHSELLAALKEVNQMIQRAAKLRNGAHKVKVVSACRAAIKANKTHAIYKIIADGTA